MVRRHAIPAAVMRFDCVMSPAEAAIGAGNHNPLSEKSFGPDIRSVYIRNARLDRLGSQRLGRSSYRLLTIGETLHVRVAFDPSNIGTLSEGERILVSPFYPKCVDDVEGPMRKVVLMKPLKDWSLRSLFLVPKSVADKPAFLGPG